MTAAVGFDSFATVAVIDIVTVAVAVIVIDIVTVTVTATDIAIAIVSVIDIVIATSVLGQMAPSCPSKHDCFL